MTEEQCRQKLNEYREAAGHETLVEAADDVLLHYNCFDYNGVDKPYIDFCEKVITSEQEK
jgi:hypothetical protein